MVELTRARTRRHLIQIVAAGAASLPFLGAISGMAHAGEKNYPDPNPGNDCKNDGTGPKCCFLKGTRIATPMGELPVEELSIGDEVCTLDGVSKIKWIGYDRCEKVDGKPWDEDVRPIRVARFAIDGETPHRDLYLSPGHCLFLKGVLISAAQLVNDASIARDAASDLEAIEYYHIEFDRHEVIFAEGASVESYLCVSWEAFSNAAGHERLDREVAMKPYAPIMGYRGGRDEAKALARSLISNVIDIRDPIQIAWDEIVQRAQFAQI